MVHGRKFGRNELHKQSHTECQLSLILEIPPMASLAKERGGRRRILFKAPDGKRRTIRLGKLPLKQARLIHGHIESLLAAKIDGSAPAAETSRWLAGLSDTFRGRLVAVGLAAPKEKPAFLTLGELI